MEAERNFKRIVLAYVVLTIVNIIWFTVEGINGGAVSENARDPSYVELAQIVAFLVNVFSLYLLYTFRRVGKNVFVGSVVVLYGLFFFGPVEMLTDYLDLLSNPFTYVIDAMAVMVSGAILAMLYLTEIKEKFK